MNNIQILTLKAFRKFFRKLLNGPKVIERDYINDPDQVSNLVYDRLVSNSPCMIARFGSTELTCLANYLGIHHHKRRIKQYIKGTGAPWWWDNKIIAQMQEWSGFFPAHVDKIEEFCQLMLKDTPEVDILGSWLPEERFVENELKDATKIRLMYLDPYWSKVPWTKALKGQRVLVVHPFAESIRKQYSKRELLFSNPDILPEFKSLTIIKAVQSLGKGDDRFNDWFEALNHMKQQISACDFDVCLIGCGAYGFPLAAHVKRMGKKAVHIGGSLQLLFGIRGKRWEVYDPHYEQPGNVFIHYHGLPNEHWIRPGEEEKPANHQNVENSCYW